MVIFISYFSPLGVGLRQPNIGLGYYLESGLIPNDVIIDLNGSPIVDLNNHYVVLG